ncbi:hypothetical protein MJK72_11125 [Klebsiella pneumoniae]|nr:hypothetical protein MJK72_11125 [Klebsiella pneumoniae]
MSQGAMYTYFKSKDESQGYCTGRTEPALTAHNTATYAGSILIKLCTSHPVLVKIVIFYHASTLG